MISPGFFSFFNAQRALVTAQTAMNTVNHNIANANTPGYSRQRVDLEAHRAYSDPIIEAHLGEFGQLGQGVLVDQIVRIRDSFLDEQFRIENGIFGEASSARDVMQQIEGILAEPSTAGANTAIQNFFDAAQEVSISPDSLAARTDFAQQAVDLITVFQQQMIQLRDLRENLVGDAAVSGSFNDSVLAIRVDEVNSLIENITQINREINVIFATGAQPNDLFDKRDQLLDELSQYVDVSMTQLANGQIAVDIAGGNNVINATVQTDSLQVVANPGPGPPTPTDVPALVQLVSTGANVNNTIASGDLRGILDMGENTAGVSSIYQVMEDLNNLFVTIADEVDLLQVAGFDMNGNAAPPEIFVLAAGTDLEVFRFSVNNAILNDPTQIAAAINDPTATGPPAGFAGIGDGRNLLQMAQLRNANFAALGNTNTEDFFNAIVSGLGIDTRSAEERAETQNFLLNSLDMQRESISGVNVDEEMIDLLRFQRAFEASSRLIQAFDEITQTIINMA